MWRRSLSLGYRAWYTGFPQFGVCILGLFPVDEGVAFLQVREAGTERHLHRCTTSGPTNKKALTMRLETSCRLGGPLDLTPGWTGFALRFSGSCRAVLVLHGRLGQCLWYDWPFAAGTP